MTTNPRPELDQNLESGYLSEGTATLSEEQYRKKMERRKSVQEERLAARSLEKGLVIVHTGDGKGKTTAALGMVMRALGHGYRVGIVQFIKGAWEPAEKAVLGR